MNHRASPSKGLATTLDPKRLVVALLFTFAVAGCNREGVCIEDDACKPKTKQSDCKGTWHAYNPGDGDLGMANGTNTCVSKGYSESFGSGFRKRRDRR
ncbi:hypothetical protein [Polyangium spumosum]|uniref:Lipoprotein n=1 Tax=Polyangium spumosum TaxID=889282 RepID=A0A6N7Q8C7_9BACT|nr:hypothetical protein [Polyangium spumosum]MRG97121.1 hypothetical protein [Polyangium spumosum]